MVTVEEVARVSSKRQITIPISICKELGIKSGDKILFLRDKRGIRLANSSVNTLLKAQKAFAGFAEELDLKSEQDVVDLVKEVRAERAKENARDARY